MWYVVKVVEIINTFVYYLEKIVISEVQGVHGTCKLYKSIILLHQN